MLALLNYPYAHMPSGLGCGLFYGWLHVRCLTGCRTVLRNYLQYYYFCDNFLNITFSFNLEFYILPDFSYFISTWIIFSGMFGALSDIWDGEFCRGAIDFALWTAFVKSVQSCVQSLLGHPRWGFLQMLYWVLSKSHAAGCCNISTTAINSET